MRIAELSLDTEVLQKLIALSVDWAEEQSCRGYRANTEKDIAGNRIFAALEGEEIIGYLFGHKGVTEKDTSVYKCGEDYFELEELYVVPRYRNRGIGAKLFRYAEERIKQDAGLILLGTATKNYKAILHFYIEELEMEFWNAALFKRI